MYILIRIGFNDSRSPEKVSKFKKKLEDSIKKEGYYYSRKMRRYIDDKNTEPGGSGVDYLIEEIEEI